MKNITTLKSGHRTLLSIMVLILFLCALNVVKAENYQSPSNAQSTAPVFSAKSTEKASSQAKAEQPFTLKRVKDSVTTMGKTREEHRLIKNKKQNVLHLVTKTPQISSIDSNVYSSFSNNDYIFTDFSIYRAFTYLLDDIDGDGFYRSFSIVFDADIYYDVYADVYAELYLRKDGGPWIHYYSTDIFTIYGESEEDEFEVNTTLEQGFEEGYYDVLIDLYDANSDTLLVSYGSDDSNTLYAIALESSEYDVIYVNEVIYSNGGSYTLVTLLTMLLTISFRIKKAKAIE